MGEDMSKSNKSIVTSIFMTVGISVSLAACNVRVSGDGGGGGAPTPQERPVENLKVTTENGSDQLNEIHFEGPRGAAPREYLFTIETEAEMSVVFEEAMKVSLCLRDPIFDLSWQEMGNANTVRAEVDWINPRNAFQLRANRVYRLRFVFTHLDTCDLASLQFLIRSLSQQSLDWF